MNVEPLIEARMGLGESIIWDEKRREVLWVDVGYPSTLYRYQFVDGTTIKVEFDFLLSAVVLTDRPDVVILLSDVGLKLFNIITEEVEHFLDVEPNQPANRCNDCGVDAVGRLWFGTMENNMNRDNSGRSIGKKGSLYCLSDGALVRQDSGLGIPNTLLWSADDLTFYGADSIEATIYRYSYDGQTITDRTIFSDVKTNGVPDGSTLDSEGNLWNCRWGDSAVFVFSPDGTLSRKISIPALQVTSCTFGGDDMKTLFITTACYAMSEEEKQQYPLAGSVFQLKTETVGTTRNRAQII